MQDPLLRYLKARKTVPSAQLVDPAPDPKTLESMLVVAARVPDHGKLAPWRFIVYERRNRAETVEGLKRIAGRHPDEKEGRIRSDKTAGFAQTPLIVGVVSSPMADHPKIPLWEQELSVGAVCLNLLHAAQANGFSAQWLTGWFAYDAEAQRWLGLKEGEKVAGFIHIGTPTSAGLALPERDRPNLSAITTHWEPAGHPG